MNPGESYTSDTPAVIALWDSNIHAGNMCRMVSKHKNPNALQAVTTFMYRKNWKYFDNCLEQYSMSDLYYNKKLASWLQRAEAESTSDTTPGNMRATLKHNDPFMLLGYGPCQPVAKGPVIMHIRILVSQEDGMRDCFVSMLHLHDSYYDIERLV